MKPSPRHKGGRWPYGVVAEIPTTRSYIVDTPTGMTRRNRAHVRPSAPPPAGSLVPKSWGKHLNRSLGPINPPSLKPTREATINPPEEVYIIHHHVYHYQLWMTLSHMLYNLPWPTKRQQPPHCPSASR